ncbi:hypothetical protein BC835DRAFT_1311314 [Cytidiella melzeri]|nr:hypothetical protein BC835DRAFT_1311314 [Cytidiella melzeri]
MWVWYTVRRVEAMRRHMRVGEVGLQVALERKFKVVVWGVERRIAKRQDDIRPHELHEPSACLWCLIPECLCIRAMTEMRGYESAPEYQVHNKRENAPFFSLARLSTNDLRPAHSSLVLPVALYHLEEGDPDMPVNMGGSDISVPEERQTFWLMRRSDGRVRGFQTLSGTCKRRDGGWSGSRGGGRRAFRTERVDDGDFEADVLENEEREFAEETDLLVHPSPLRGPSKPV